MLGLLGHNKGIPQQCSPHVLRWAPTLSGYQYRLAYHPGVEFGNADGLSRLPQPGGSSTDVVSGNLFMLEKIFPSLLSATAMAQATNKDPIISAVREALWNSNRLPDIVEWRSFSGRIEDCLVQDSGVLWGCRVVVPASLNPLGQPC